MDMTSNENIRERLIAIIEKAQEEAADTIGSMNGGFAAWYADKLIEAGVLFDERRWIPVTERMPDRDAVVLAYFPEMDGTECRIQVQKGWSVAKFCSHWMPLPDAPGEECDG